MKIEKIFVQNYKSIEEAEIGLPRFYSTICGRNNSGKSSVISAIRGIFTEEEIDYYYDDEQYNAIKDFPVWKREKENEHIIRINLSIRVYQDADRGIFKFIETFLSEEKTGESFVIELKKEIDCAKEVEKRGVSVDGEIIEDDYTIQEIHKKFRSSRAFIFHNSTAPTHPYIYRRDIFSFSGEITEDDKKKLNQAKKRLMGVYNGIAKRQKKDIEETLGRLEEKYEVGITVPSFDTDRFPINLTLSDKKVELPLSDWGSGTQNRTRIFLAILRAKRISDSASDSDKVTPFILIEEPECFLHPSAQAEFGSALRDLSEEFGVQVICTSHSPYMLSVQHPESNVLLERKVYRGNELQTEVVDTSGDNWMEPFALSLGLDNSAFRDWKNLLFQNLSRRFSR
jgi:predicted ATP-dependent endonuclease of OLD family